MNVKDVKETAGKVTCRLEEIFSRQHELADKYQGIEEANGIGRAVVKGCPFDLDDRRWQYLIKDFAWRVIEEVGEALDAWNGAEDEHAQEEMADGLHFFVEMLLLIGMTPDDLCEMPGIGDRLVDLFPSTDHSPSGAVADLVEHLGMAMCSLKLKPWKQTAFPTDVKEFRKRLVRAFCSYLDVAEAMKLRPQSLYEMYFKKNVVNQFRIESRY
jgi:hypothetical protein